MLESRLAICVHYVELVKHYKGGRSSAVSTGRLYPRINPWYLISEAESTSQLTGSTNNLIMAHLQGRNM